MAPHMSAESASTGSVSSYSDVKHEQIQFDFLSPSGADDNQAFGQADVEPLSEDGGLDRNELAEVHAYRLVLGLQIEGVDSIAEYPTVPSSTQVRGGIGINLSQEEILNGTTGESPTEPDGMGTGAVFTQDEEGLIQHFILDKEIGYFDSSDGYGGGGSLHTSGDGLTCFPVDFGFRGPVLDANDEISCAAVEISELASNFEVTVEANITLDMTYRMHEVEGVRNDFSLPR